MQVMGGIKAPNKAFVLLVLFFAFLVIA